jgi:shikimate dehydrogenase
MGAAEGPVTSVGPARARCAVLGSPVAHSLSPVLHRAAYAELGLDWRYDAVEVTEAGLAGFLDGLDATTWRGLSLTMPLKRTVVPLLDEMSERARVARAANTVVLEGGRRLGDNTDIPGIVAALAERGAADVDTALVLGGGATAASAVLALCDLGARGVTLAVRDPSRAQETLDAVARHPTPVPVDVVPLTRPDAAGEALWDLLVSTIPATAQTAPLTRLVDDVDVVFEVLYEPWPTPLARAATLARRVLVGGLDLLVHQAVLQVQLMTGRPGPLAAMRAAGEAALAARSA